MPAHPPVPGAIKTEVLWTQGGVPCANVMYIGYTGTEPASSDLATLAHAVITQLQTALEAYSPSSTTCSEVICTDLSSSSGAVGSSSSTWSGTDSGGNFLSAGSSVMVNWHIARRYRGGKCRTYLPAPLGDRMATPSTLNASYIALIVPGLTSFLGSMTGTFGALTTTGLVCVSYTSDKAPRVVPLVQPVTGFAVSTLIRTQRRRITASTF